MPTGWVKMPDEVYHLQDELSSSQLRAFMVSPKLYIWEKAHEAKKTEALDFGSAVHLAVLEPDEYPNFVVCGPDISRRSNEGKAAWARFMAGLKPGTVVLDDDDIKKIGYMADVMHNSPEFMEKLNAAKMVEMAGFAEIQGVPCRIKVDAGNDEWLLDYKSALSCRPGAFLSSFRKYGYGIQAAFYTLVAYAIDGKMRQKFYFVAQDKAAPNDWMLYEVGQDYLVQAIKEIRQALGRFAACLESGEWPGFSKREHLIELPYWFDGTKPLFGELDAEE